MKRRLVTRRSALRGLLAGGAALSTAGCSGLYLPPTFGSIWAPADALTYSTQRLLLAKQPLAREFDRGAITRNFPAINTVEPEDDTYRRLAHNSFVDWRLPVTGLVTRPLSLSLAELQAFPSRTQITQHNCERGWSAIAEWTGVQLARVLLAAGVHPKARYVVFRCVDGWWDSLDMFDALHPQTLLAYGMNGRTIPMQHGAPIRLRVERQLGYKSLKFVNSIELVEDVRHIEDGSGAFVTAFGYSWYAGI